MYVFSYYINRKNKFIATMRFNFFHLGINYHYLCAA
jgi:hypothetical protein